jgi:hypothetical protein
MTKQEFYDRLEKVRVDINRLMDDAHNALPKAIKEEKWVAEDEVTMHIFLFVAQTFCENMDEVLTRICPIDR